MEVGLITMDRDAATVAAASVRSLRLDVIFICGWWAKKFFVI